MASEEIENGHSSRLYIRGLGENITKEDVQTECSKYGTVKQIWLAMRPDGFAFVDFDTVSEAEEALQELNGTETLGSDKLEVDIVKLPNDSDEKDELDE